MDIWIIRDGEKAGPIHDYDVRHKIAAGEFTADTPAWHEGLAEWRPLARIGIFEDEFARKEAVPPPVEEQATEQPPGPPPLPKQTRFGRRFWARWCDMFCYGGIWWLGMWAADQNIKAALLNPWIMFFHYVPWFIFEALLIHHFATTPGKWLLGLRVVNQDDTKLSLKAATRRSTRVMLTGVGFGWDVLAIFCQGLSFYIGRKLGATLWDHAGGHKVESAPIHPLRGIVFVALFAGALLLRWLVISPYVWEYVKAENKDPVAAKYLETHEPWSLPKRK